MDYYTVVILLTLVGFLALAFVLLAPVYRFLKRQERLGEEWTEAIDAHRQGRPPASANGAEPPPADDPES